MQPDQQPTAELPDDPGALRELLEASRAELAATRSELAEAAQEVELWRTRAVQGWARAASEVQHTARGRDAAALARELDAMERSLSWRLTAPLRVSRLVASVRSALRRASRR